MSTIKEQEYNKGFDLQLWNKLLRFAKPYKGYAILNIISNIFYALFGTLAMVSLFPMLNVLFGKSKRI